MEIFWFYGVILTMKASLFEGFMENIWFYVVPTIGGLILFGIMSAAVKAPGASLQQKFVKLGTLQGRTLSEITKVCGAPSSIAVRDNVKIVQWIATGYHIVLLFDENNICLGVSSETAV